MNWSVRWYSFWGCLRLVMGGASIGRNLQIEGPLNILIRDGASLKNLQIGDNVTLGGQVYIRMRKNGKIRLGNGVKTGTEVWLVCANDAELKVEENAILGSYSIFNGGHGLRIGKNCIFAAFVYMNSSDHGFEHGELIQKQAFQGGPIDIGEDVWLGGHTFINTGITIGDGCVIGSGAVVTKSIASYKIAAGNPATVIRDRQ